MPSDNANAWLPDVLLTVKLQGETMFKIKQLYTPFKTMFTGLLVCAALSLPVFAADLTLPEQAQAAFQAKAYSQALALYLPLLADNPGSAELHYQVGSAALLSGDAVLARSHLQKALELAPDHLFALNHLGLAFIQLEDLAAARSLYIQALLTRPLARELWFNLGQLELIQSKLDSPASVPDAARAAWQRALAIKREPALEKKLQALPPAVSPAFEPAAALSGYRQAVALEEQGKTAAALGAFSQLLKVHPSCAAAAFRRARIYVAAQNWRGALADLNQVIQQDPNHAAAYYERARLAIRAKNLVGAEADLYHVLWLRPEHDSARGLLLQVLTAQNQGAQLVVLLRDYLRFRPEDESARLQLVHWELKLNHRAEAWDLLAPLAESEPVNASALHLLGKLAHLNGQKSKAESFFVQAFAIAPPPQEALPEAAFWLSRQGRAGEALKYLESYLKTHPRDTQTLVAAGILASQQGQAAQAIAWLEQAQKQAPGQREISKYLGLAWLKQGQKDKARSTIKLYLQQNPAAADAPALQELLKTLTPAPKRN
jgi:tetratricopeptide (TPR) repeat protein